MSAAAATSSRRASRNQRITRRRIRSVSAAKSAAVIGRAGRNVGAASLPAWSAAGTKTPSITQACRCTWWLSAEPKRWRKEMPPSRGRAALGMAASGVPPDAASRRRSGPLRGFPPGEPALKVLRDDVVERRLLGPTPLVAAGRRGAAMWAASDSRGKPVTAATMGGPAGGRHE
jgi:hypothetical protein